MEAARAPGRDDAEQPLAKRTKARILQASTSEVYGDPLTSPQVEEDWGNVNCNGVRSCYDEGKRAAETLFFDYHRQNSVDIRVARIFNTYGPGMHPYDVRVVSNFLVHARATHRRRTARATTPAAPSHCHRSKGSELVLPE